MTTEIKTFNEDHIKYDGVSYPEPPDNALRYTYSINREEHLAVEDLIAYIRFARAARVAQTALRFTMRWAIGTAH